ncbi:uncharacterized protein LOC124439434 [Xenia sp. Carnegie-2017]|uniref:uncharacterized protein LOC124439434 n=1 Tax=Xenia sp. Carnegie-2017 TaxID=2897299 RepID=UPI001F0371EE|nr:uncharacterized protein LOC124439434 [Xenia sp. Carnegie-2017]
MGHLSGSVSQPSKTSSLTRHHRTSQRALIRRLQFEQTGENKEKQAISTQQVEATSEKMVDNGPHFRHLTDPRYHLECNSGINNDMGEGLEADNLDTESQETQTEYMSTRSIEVQTDLLSIDIDLLQEKTTRNSTNDPLAPENLTDDEKLRFYTGLPNMAVFMGILELISPGLVMRNSLTRFQQMLLTLMRLRLNLPVQDLGYRFGIHASTVSRVFQSCIDVMFSSMKFLIHWPDREQLRLTLPMCFRERCSSCAVIIDCFEVFIDRPSDFLARAHTWSSYKHHNTAKFLIGITPQGTVSFISKAWGGSVRQIYY